MIGAVNRVGQNPEASKLQEIQQLQQQKNLTQVQPQTNPFAPKTPEKAQEPNKAPSMKEQENTVQNINEQIEKLQKQMMMTKAHMGN